MNDISFLPSTVADIAHTIAWEQDATNKKYIRPYSHQQHLAAISDPDMLHWQVCREGKKIGLVLLVKHYEGDELVVEFRRIIIVTKGLGLGKTCIEAVKKVVAEELRASRLWLDVFDFNSRARHLYQAAGFREIDSSPNATGEHQVLLMEIRFSS